MHQCVYTVYYSYTETLLKRIQIRITVKELYSEYEYYISMYIAMLKRIQLFHSREKRKLREIP